MVGMVGFKEGPFVNTRGGQLFKDFALCRIGSVIWIAGLLLGNSELITLFFRQWQLDRCNTVAVRVSLFTLAREIEMDMHSADSLHYRLTRIGTEAATGYFDALPEGEWDFGRALAWCRSRPNDDFMRKQMLRLIAQLEPEAVKQRILAAADEDLFLKALYFEACLLFSPLAPLRKHFPIRLRPRLAGHTPMIFIKAHLREGHLLHRHWTEKLRTNFFQHAPLMTLNALGLEAPVDDESMARAMAVAEPLDRLAAMSPSEPVSDPGKPLNPEALTQMALHRLEQVGIEVGQEMRHESSLSPIALLRSWQLELTVACGRQRYRLDGEQIAYGRGLELEAARVACTMEIVERVSSYATVAATELVGYQQPYPLVRASLSELKRSGRSALDPNRLGLEANYRDEPLYWIEGRRIAKDGAHPILVPAQCVFLFCNLDEVSLSSGLGSNGLGAGASLVQAKCKALLEVIERDSAATIPYVPELCFDVESGDERIAGLLHAYAQRGIHVGFLDLTGPLGVPCCKSYVVHPDGEVAIGTSAHLNAKQALVSALTETPYPFPNGPPSRPLPAVGVRVPLEALPNYDRGDADQNLALLEQLLLANGFGPIYIDLTRADLDLPVVRAIVPGMETLGEFDRFSRVHPRLYGHYLKYAS